LNCINDQYRCSMWIMVKPVTNRNCLLRGVSARYLFQRFPALKQRLWGGHLWLSSYYVGAAGTVSAATIERSEHVTKRR
jgi:REP element-mobilizing transposase RayT